LGWSMGWNTSGAAAICPGFSMSIRLSADAYPSCHEWAKPNLP
jgi:hypothetical protein